LAQAIEVEIARLLAPYAAQREGQGRQALVRHGYLPEREGQTGIGAVRVKGPRVRDRSGAGIRLHSALLPPALRRSKSLEALLPWLYVQGVSMGGCSEALQALSGPDAPGLSPATLRRRKQGWQEALPQGPQRALSGKRYVYGWGDGVYGATRLAEARHCRLVISGVEATGHKELVGLWDG
jgi:transposase-like protein